MPHQDCSDIITDIEEIDPVVQDPSEISTLIPQIRALNCPISATELDNLLKASIMTCHDALVQAVIDQYVRLGRPIPNQTDTVMTAWDTMKTGTSNECSVEFYMVDYMGDDAPPDPRIRALNMIQILLSHHDTTISQDFVSSELQPLLQRPKHSIQTILIDKIHEVKAKIGEVENTHSQPASRSPSPPAALSVALPVECRPPGVTTLTESSSGGASAQRHPC